MILLDTHALLWWTDKSKKLSLLARSTIENERLTNELAISAISIWEVCMLVQSEELTLRIDIDTWLHDMMAVPFLQVIPIDATIAKTAVFLSNWSHKDPADRIIVATALRLGVPLVTKDEKIRRSKLVRTIW